MSEDPPPIRQYYQNQHLAAETAGRILAKGRVLAKRRRRFIAVTLSAAAALVLCVGAAMLRVGSAKSPTVLITATDVQQAVMHYFAFPERPLSSHSGNPVALQHWLQTKQAPADFTLPGSLKAAQSIGCRVLNVQGRQVSLMCFYADSVQPGAAGPPGRALYSAVGRAWTFVLGAPRPMIHLIVASRSDFQAPPEPGALVRLNPREGWRFVAWTVGEKVFFAASAHPNVAIEEIVSAM
ncbi:MAG: hypothetical protein ABIZ04_07995 [Opitutus sp.]